MPDIFEAILEKRKKDVFSRLKESSDAEKAIEEAITKSNRDVLTSVKAYVKANKYIPPPPPKPIDIDAEIKKRLPDFEKIKFEIKTNILNNLPTQTIIQPAIEKIIEKQTPIILKKEIEKKIEVPQFDLKIIDDLKKEIESLKKSLKNAEENSGGVFFPNPPIIPNWTDKRGKYLTNNGDNLKWDDVSSNGGASANPFYIGDSATEGTWRFYNDGTNLLFQRLESGTWVEKGAMVA